MSSIEELEKRLKKAEDKLERVGSFAIVESRVGRYADYSNRREADEYAKNLIILGVDKITNQDVLKDDRRIKATNEKIVKDLIEEFELDEETFGLKVTFGQVAGIERLNGREWNGPGEAPKYAGRDKLRVIFINNLFRDVWIYCCKHKDLKHVVPETSFNDRQFTDYLYSEKRRLNSDPDGTHWWYIRNGRLLRGAKRKATDKFDPDRAGGNSNNRRRRGGGGNGGFNFGFPNGIGEGFETGGTARVRNAANSKNKGSGSKSTGQSDEAMDVWGIINQRLNLPDFDTDDETPKLSMKDHLKRKKSPTKKKATRNETVSSIFDNWDDNSSTANDEWDDLDVEEISIFDDYDENRIEYFRLSPNSRGDRPKTRKRRTNSYPGPIPSAERLANLAKVSSKRFEENRAKVMASHLNGSDVSVLNLTDKVNALIDARKPIPRTISERSPKDDESNKAMKVMDDDGATIKLITDKGQEIIPVSRGPDETNAASGEEEDDDEAIVTDGEKDPQEKSKETDSSDDNEDENPNVNSSTSNDCHADSDEIEAALDQENVPEEKTTYTPGCTTNNATVTITKNLTGPDAIKPEDLFLQITEKYGLIKSPQCLQRQRMFEQFVQDVYGLHFLFYACEDLKRKNRIKEWCISSLDFTQDLMKLTSFVISNKWNFTSIKKKSENISVGKDAPIVFTTISTLNNYVMKRQEVLKKATTDFEKVKIREDLNASINANTSLTDSQFLDIFND